MKYLKHLDLSAPPLSLKCAPLSPQMGAALVGAGSSFLGNLFNIGSQKSANQANLQLAKMQNDWNERMWEKNNLYNTPSAQVGRLLDAGINPLGQNFTSYQSQPVQSAPLANQVAPQIDPNSMVTGASTLVGAYADQDLKNAQTLATLASIPGVKGDSKTKAKFGERAEELADNAVENGKAEIEQRKQQANLLILQGQKVASETKYQDLCNEWLPNEKYMSLAECASRIQVNAETAEDIKQLRPYKKKLMSAQTADHYASAADHYASAEHHRASAREADAHASWYKEDEKRVKEDVLRVMADKNLKTRQEKLLKLEEDWRKEYGFTDKYGMNLLAHGEYVIAHHGPKAVSYGLNLVGKIYDGVVEGLGKARGFLPNLPPADIPPGYGNNPYFQSQSHSNPINK